METELANGGYIRFANESAGWALSFPRLFEWRGNSYLIEDLSKEAPGLPVEFYAHQLLEVDPYNADSLLEFASRWGVPHHPCRDFGNGWPERPSGVFFEEVPLMKSISSGYLNTCEDRRMLAGIMATNAARGFGMRRISSKRLELPPDYMAASFVFGAPALWRELGDTESRKSISFRGGNVVSLLEVSAVVEASQRAIRSLLVWVGDALAGRCDIAGFPQETVFYDAWEFASYAATRGAIPADSRAADMDGSFTAAVFDQFQATLISPEPWKICANDECRKPFKRKQNSPGATSKSGRYSPSARYCCEKCRNSAGNRRKKQRIDHGI